MADRVPTEQDKRVAAQWLHVLLFKSGFPNPAVLQQHLADVEITGFCDCGCNSFCLATSALAAPLVPASPNKGSLLVFEANFHELGSERPLDILLFVNQPGYASFVEVDYCVNSYPVPENLVIEDNPFGTHIHPELAAHL